jgi:hypothetical protein
MKMKAPVRVELSDEQNDAIDKVIETFAPAEGRRFLPAEFPRELAQTELTQVPTEAEFKAAEKSMFYWWWSFLKESPEYPPKRGERKSGPVADLYRDFGALGDDFRGWWRRTGRHVFSEPEGPAVRTLYDSAWDGDDNEDTAEVLIVEVYKYLPRAKIEKDFRLLLKAHHPGAVLKEHNHKQARRQLFPRERKQDKAFKNLLETWREARNAKASWTAIGAKLPRNVGKKGRLNSVAIAQAKAPHLNKRAKDYYKRAEKLIHHAARGDFPRED